MRHPACDAILIDGLVQQMRSKAEWFDSSIVNWNNRNKIYNMLNNNSQAKLGCQLHLMLLMFSHTMDVSLSSLLFSSFLASSLFSSVLYFLLVANVAYAQFACSSSCSMQCRCLDCDKYRLIDVAVVLISRVFVCVCFCVCVCIGVRVCVCA